MMRKSIWSMALAGLIAPGLSSGQTLSYNFVQGGLAAYPSFGSGPDGSQDFIGVDGNLKIALTQNVFALGGAQFLTDDVDFTTLHAGAAYRLMIDPVTDLWGGLTVEYQEFSNGDTVDDTSLGVRGGVRHRLSDEWELAGQLRVVTGDLDYIGVRGTARYFFREDIALVGEVDVLDGDLGLIGGAMITF